MEEQKEHFARPTMERPPSLLNLTLLTLLVGVLAGLGGYLLGQSILPNTNIDYLNLSPWPRGNSQDTVLVDLAQKTSGSIAGVYRSAATNTAVGGTLLGQEDFLGSAVVVTSDGWLLSTNQVVKNKNVTIVLGDKLYVPTEIKNDVFSNAVFVKINANLLSPIDFQLTDAIRTGENIYVGLDAAGSAGHSFYPNVLANDHYVVAKYLSTDKIDYYLQTAMTADFNVLSAPFFNSRGNLIGLGYDLGGQALLLPAEYLKQAVKNMLNGTERVKLGLSYVDWDNNSGFSQKGVLVYNPNTSAVVYNLPAGKAGIKSGDQIVAVNNNVISANLSLTSILQNYRPGEKVILKIFRNGQPQDIEVQL